MIEFIDSYDKLHEFAEHLLNCDRIALDTEAASFHRYSQRSCLVQVSTGAVDAIIDPMAVPDLSGLMAPLSSGDLLVVMHDADSDLRALDRDFALRVARVFDTRVAAQLLGEPGIGLAALLEKYLEITLDKRFQRADWSMRPLSADMVEYAVTDTKHLVALSDRLRGELLAGGRLEWAQEEFSLLPAVRWSPREQDPDAYLRVAGVRRLSPVQRTLARALYECRDTIAREMDRAPFRVMGNEHLVAIAAAEPRTLSELSGVPRMPPSIVQRYGSRIVAALTDALSKPLVETSRRPARSREPHDPTVEERVSRLKALRSARALQYQIDPGVLFPNGTLVALARAWSGPQTDFDSVPSLRRWQRGVLGEVSLREALAG